MLDEIEKDGIVHKLSDKSKRMLSLIKDNPGISAKEIQKQLNEDFRSILSREIEKLREEVSKTTFKKELDLDIEEIQTK